MRGSLQAAASEAARACQCCLVVSEAEGGGGTRALYRKRDGTVAEHEFNDGTEICSTCSLIARPAHAPRTQQRCRR
jgi:hypothetical protein